MFLPDTIYNRIIDGISLGEDRTPDSGKWGDRGSLENASKVDDKVRSPRHEP